MQLSLVLSTPITDATVSACGDSERLPANRRMRIDFGTASVFLTTAAALELANTIHAVRNEILADAIRQGVEASEFIPL